MQIERSTKPLYLCKDSLLVLGEWGTKLYYARVNKTLSLYQNLDRINLILKSPILPTIRVC